MAFGDRTRRPGGMQGGNQGQNGGGQGQRRFGGGNNGGGDGEGRRGNDRPRSVWAKSESLYCDYSCVELQVVAEWFRSAAAFKFAPAIDGSATEDGQRRYNHDDGVPIFVTLSLRELVAFRLQLRALLDGSIATIQVLRNQGNAPHKVLSLFSADQLEGGDANDIAFAVDEYANGYAAGSDPTKTIIFIAKQESIVLGVDEAGNDVVTPFFPDLEAIYAFTESYVANVARVDFASTRLIDFGGRSGGEQRQSAPTTAMPQRRRPGAPAGGEQQQGGGGESGEVSSSDIDGAFGGRADVSDESMRDM